MEQRNIVKNGGTPQKNEQLCFRRAWYFHHRVFSAFNLSMLSFRSRQPVCSRGKHVSLSRQRDANVIVADKDERDWRLFGGLFVFVIRFSVFLIIKKSQNKFPALLPTFQFRFARVFLNSCHLANVKKQTMFLVYQSLLFFSFRCNTC